jgi:hypothetical protein
MEPISAVEGNYQPPYRDQREANREWRATGEANSGGARWGFNAVQSGHFTTIQVATDDHTPFYTEADELVIKVIELTFRDLQQANPKSPEFRDAKWYFTSPNSQWATHQSVLQVIDPDLVQAKALALIKQREREGAKVRRSTKVKKAA